ncbi:hypothetical protein EV360DRAFT_42090 [Lentinula raphanica]|nr:hypothetical protein EV360DRAFT_42090 [Lentinula raphanica]
MVNAARQRKDKNALKFWTYGLNCLYKLKHEGMSEEEDATVTHIVNGVETHEQVRHVLAPDFRHPVLRPYWQLVDQTRGLEDMIFKQTGRARMRRIRVDKVSNLPPPKHLPASFFRDGYLDSLMEHEKDDLRLSKREFVLYSFPGYNPQQAPQAGPSEAGPSSSAA